MRSNPRRFVVGRGLEPLEGRQVLAVTAAPVTPAALARLHLDFRAVQDDIARLQLTSHVTPAEIHALQHDLDACYPPHSAGLNPRTAATHGVVADLNYQITYAFVEGSSPASGWTLTEKKIAADYAALGCTVPPATLDRVSADLQAIAHSAGVSRAGFKQLMADNLAFLAEEKRDDPAAYNGTRPTPAQIEAWDPAHYLGSQIHGFIPGARANPAIFVTD